MNILAIETSSEACSCALLSAAGIVESYEVAPRRHTQLLLAMIDQVLHESALQLRDVDLFAYGQGPGSFTGVRIAACAVQALALAQQRPVVPISSLAAAALRGASGAPRVIAAFDARLGEVYVGAFSIAADGTVVAVGEEQLAAPGAVALPCAEAWVGVGAGWAAHGGVLRSRMGARLHAVDAQVLPGAAQVAALAAACPQAGVAAASAVPRYLRRDVATPRAGAQAPAMTSC